MAGVALRDTGLAIRDLCALARAAEDAGYNSIWVPEVGSRDALTLCAVLGSVTHRARVGTGVVPAPSRNPVTLALGAATAAEASQGRFTLGLGAGHRFASEHWYDVAWTRPRTRLRETVDIVRRVLAGERVHHDGIVRVDGFHLMSTPPHVPVFLAATTPGTLRLAGEVADGVILNWLPPEGVERAALLGREAAADAGRAIDVAAYVRVAVTGGPDDEEHARAVMREQTYAYMSLPSYAHAISGLDPELATAVSHMNDDDEGALDDLTSSLCLWGPAETVRDRLRAYEKAGVDELVIYPVAFGDDPAASVLHTIRALAP